VLPAPLGAGGGENVGHHRYKITLELSGEMKETKSEGAAPPDDGVKAKVKQRLAGLDVGSNFKITQINVDRYTKEVQPDD
jgi:hypothetical protein